MTGPVKERLETGRGEPRRGAAPIDRLDGRVRLLASFGFALLVAVLRHPSSLLLALGVALALIPVAGLPIRLVVRRLLGVGFFLGVVLLLVPMATPGEELVALGPVSFTDRGLLLASTVALKACSIMLIFTALLSSAELTHLGESMKRLRLPDKLTHLFLFTVRYLQVLRREAQRLDAAMRTRCFRPRTDLHTLGSLGNLVGMLVVRSFERSDRVLAAMRCRGFRGRYPAVTPAPLCGADRVAVALFAASWLLVAGIEWWGRIH